MKARVQAALAGTALLALTALAECKTDQPESAPVCVVESAKEYGGRGPVVCDQGSEA